MTATANFQGLAVEVEPVDPAAALNQRDVRLTVRSADCVITATSAGYTIELLGNKTFNKLHYPTTARQVVNGNVISEAMSASPLTNLQAAVEQVKQADVRARGRC